MMYFRGFNGWGGCFGYGAGFVGPWMAMGVNILLLAVVAIVAVVLIRRASHKNSDDGTLDILKSRYAKGEISEEEYMKMKKVLGR